MAEVRVADEQTVLTDGVAEQGAERVAEQVTDGGAGQVTQRKADRAV